MLKNRHGFIPKRYRQPEEYRTIIFNWAAVYRHPESGEEYHIEHYSYSLNRSYERNVSVLVQCQNYRRQISPDYKTIKEAVDFLERIFEVNSSPEDLGLLAPEDHKKGVNSIGEKETAAVPLGGLRQGLRRMLQQGFRPSESTGVRIVQRV